MTDDVLIHIGYPKTGTTWLQEHLFAWPGIGFGLVDRRAVTRAVVTLPPFQFDPGVSLSLLEEEIETIGRSGSCPVISLERLVGAPAAGGFDSEILADRLAMLFPKAQILITIREQRSHIWSHYQQLVMGPKCLVTSLLNYLYPQKRGYLSRALATFSWEFHEFDRLIDHYQGRFGRDRVQVLPYEQFCSSPRSFLAEIMNLSPALPWGGFDSLPLDWRENAAVSPITVALKRRANRWVAHRNYVNRTSLIGVSRETARESKRFWRWIDGFLPSLLRDRAWKRSERDMKILVGDRFRRSNRHTSELTGLDLSDLGYDC